MQINYFPPDDIFQETISICIHHDGEGFVSGLYGHVAHVVLKLLGRTELDTEKGWKDGETEGEVGGEIGHTKKEDRERDGEMEGQRKRERKKGQMEREEGKEDGTQKRDWGRGGWGRERGTRNNNTIKAILSGTLLLRDYHSELQTKTESTWRN